MISCRYFKPAYGAGLLGGKLGQSWAGLFLHKIILTAAQNFAIMSSPPTSFELPLSAGSRRLLHLEVFHIRRWRELSSNFYLADSHL
jgi:hypothetical protein